MGSFFPPSLLRLTDLSKSGGLPPPPAQLPPGSDGPEQVGMGVGMGLSAPCFFCFMLIFLISWTVKIWGVDLPLSPTAPRFRRSWAARHGCGYEYGPLGLPASYVSCCIIFNKTASLAANVKKDSRLKWSKSFLRCLLIWKAWIGFGPNIS